jgi:hypothetical protein
LPPCLFRPLICTGVKVAVVVPNHEVLHNWLNASALPEASVCHAALQCACTHVLKTITDA